MDSIHSSDVCLFLPHQMESDPSVCKRSGVSAGRKQRRRSAFGRKQLRFHINKRRSDNSSRIWCDTWPARAVICERSGDQRVAVVLVLFLTKSIQASNGKRRWCLLRARLFQVSRFPLFSSKFASQWFARTREPGAAAPDEFQMWQAAWKVSEKLQQAISHFSKWHSEVTA